jgi:hypothetical protein
MPLPQAGSEGASEYICKCKKCARHREDGKKVSRRTWYRHNPGGKGKKLPKLTLNEIDLMLEIPTPELSKKRRRRLERDLEAARERIYMRTAGSGSVGPISNRDICAIFKELCT